MICYECGHKIKGDFAKFCNHCGSSLEIKSKQASTKKETIIQIEEEINQAENLFLLWNISIAAMFVFYIIHAVTDSYIHLFLLVLLMMTMSWMLLLIKLHDLAILKHDSMKKFILSNFGLPLLGTFYYFLRITKK